MRWLLLFLLAGCSQAVEIIVAPDGDDNALGTSAAPVASPLRGRELARQALARGDRRVTVRLRAGIYVLRETLSLGLADTAPGAQVLWQGDDGAILSGGVPLSGWKATAAGRWSCVLPLDRSNPGGLPTVARGGSLVLPSRWPATQPAVVLVHRDGALILKPKPPIGRGELLAWFAWGASRAPVRIVENAGRSVHLPADLPWATSPGKAPTPGRPVFIEGLATPELGFWRVMADSQIELAAGKQPADGELRMAALAEVLVIEGQPDQLLRGLEIRDLRIAHGAWPRPAAGLESVQAGHFAALVNESGVLPIPGAVRLAWAEGIRLSGVTVEATAGCGIVLGAGCRGVRLERCTVREAGGCGIIVGWRGAGLDSASVDWTDPLAAPRDNVINRCLVVDCGRLDWGSVGIADMFSSGTVITGNRIEDLPYTGISLGLRWDTSATSQRRARVEGNHIRRVMRKLLDGAGIYTLGWQPGAVISGNLIEQLGNPGFCEGAPAGGLFFDEGSKGIEVKDNIISDIIGEPIRFNGCAQSWLILGHNTVVGDGEPAPLPPAVAEGVGP